MGLSIKQLAVHLRVCVDTSAKLQEPYHTDSESASSVG